jgi:hypothetical protein
LLKVLFNSFEHIHEFIPIWYQCCRLSSFNRINNLSVSYFLAFFFDWCWHILLLIKLIFINPSTTLFLMIRLMRVVIALTILLIEILALLHLSLFPLFDSVLFYILTRIKQHRNVDGMYTMCLLRIASLIRLGIKWFRCLFFHNFGT